MQPAMRPDGMIRGLPCLATILLWLASSFAWANEGDYFEIRIVDHRTGRGVPLVELKTVNNIRFHTDSAGRVAFNEPGLMNQQVYFGIKSHGYEFPGDGFGFRGHRVLTRAGSRVELKIKRLNIAERLYRVTGAGIYRDTILLGHKPPIRQPLLNAQVLGSDSVVNTVYRGRIYWFWGDTNRVSYPLGNFHVPGATSLLPVKGRLPPSRGIDLDYFVDSRGFAKPTCQMPGQGPTWINGLVTLSDSNGKERLFAKYVKVKNGLTIYERGLVEFDDQRQQFRKRAQFDIQAPLYPTGHPLEHRVDGVDYIYFPNPYPLVRVRARADWLSDPARYQAYTCFKQGSREDNFVLDRNGDGRLRYGWKTDTLPLTLKRQRKLIKAGRMTSDEGLFRLKDATSGKPVVAHRGSVYYNAYRKCWIMITAENFGTSLLGEIWYAEAPAPEGPWLRARKIVTHEKYSFYNPKQHPMFDEDGGRFILFEGTYTHAFSGNPDQTPRYDYNQIMYRLDLADPRLAAVHDRDTSPPPER